MKTYKIRILVSLAFLWSYFTYAQNYEPGNTVGKIDVTENGALNYTIPITIPAGFQDITPEVSIVYNGQTANERVGYGWSIVGVSSITRVAPTTFYDGYTNPINLSERDQFALDGQRLLLVSGKHGHDESEYVTAQFSNLRIKAYGGNSSNNFTPRYFIVHDGKGNYSEYGRTKDSRGTLEWGLNVFHSSIQFDIIYKYINLNGALSIAEIVYGNSNPDPKPNKVVFNYDVELLNAQDNYFGGKRLVDVTRLSDIEVFTSTLKTRTYRFDYLNTGKHNILHEVQEFNSEDKPLPPIQFGYDQSDYGTVRNSKRASSSLLTNTTVENVRTISGDFSGTGTVQTVAYDPEKRDQLVYFDGIFSNSSLSLGRGIEADFDHIMVTNLSTDGFKFNNQNYPHTQTVTTVKEVGSLVVFENFGIKRGTGGFEKKFRRHWPHPEVLDCTGDSEFISNFEYYSGDFNGDGITEILVYSYEYGLLENCNSPSARFHLRTLDLSTPKGRPIKVGNKYEFPDENWAADEYRRHYVVDFDGDGTSEFIYYNSITNELRVFSLKGDTFEELYDFKDINLDIKKPILFADFNGDRKTDIANPTDINTPVWSFYMNAGTSLVNHTKDVGIWYVEPNVYSQKDRPHDFQGTDIITPKEVNKAPKLFEERYIAQDFDGDGKADILRHEVITPVEEVYKDIVSEGLWLHTVRTNQNTGEPEFTRERIYKGNNNGVRSFGNPIFINRKDDTKAVEYAYQSGNNLFTYAFKANARKDVCLKEISNNEVYTTVNYYDDGDLSERGRVYDPFFPGEELVDDNLQIAPRLNNINVVSRIDQEYVTARGSMKSRSRLFLYKAGVFDVRFGFLGFKWSSRTNWIGEGVSELWTSTRKDMKNRGLVEWVWTGPNPKSSPFTIDLTQTIYRYNILKDSRHPLIFKPALHNMWNIDTRKEQNRITDYLYDEYLNPTETTTTYIPPSYKSVTKNQYRNDLKDFSYIIGELTSTSTVRSNQLTGEEFKIDKEYTYNVGQQVTSMTTINGKGEKLVEDYMYDEVGNLVRRDFDIADGNRGFETYEYDGINVHMKSSNNYLGEKLTYTYHSDTRLKKSETDKYGYSSEYETDAWQRQKIVHSTVQDGSIDKTQAKTIIRSPNGGMQVKTTFDSGKETIEFYNSLGWLEGTSTKGLDGKVLYVITEYDVAGRVISRTEPSTKVEGSVSTKTNYDEYGRIAQVVLPTGRIVTTTYDGLTTSVDDGVNITTTVQDSEDNIISKTDPGGEILYSYYPNGELKEAKYGDHTVSMQIDAWGRRKSITDPSAGTFTFEYDKTGALKSETTPKGRTTYTYYPNGKVHRKNINGDNTQLQIEYKLDVNNRVTRTIGRDVLNKNTYDYNFKFDDYNRLIETTEQASGTIRYNFSKSLTYDQYSRIETETYKGTYSTTGVSSEITIRNVYDDNSGELIEIINESNQTSLWKLTKTNDRNQTSDVTLGNGFQLYRNYDKYGKIKDIVDFKNKPGTTDREFASSFYYAYNDQRELMGNRENKVFGYKQTFRYDNLDRLTKVLGHGVTDHMYDNRGNITSNTRTGDFKYDPKKLYRLADIELNSAGDNFYKERPLHNVKFNAFKKATTIHQEGKGRIDLEYGPLMGRTQMFFGGEEVDKKERRYHKVYSGIVPSEITYDRETKQTKIVTYLGGDSYSSPMVYIKQEGGTGNGVDEMHYIHRDHLGSIVGITDSSAKIIEQVHYGAWGNVDNKVNPVKSDAFVTDSNLLLDRGYTGHELLASVDLVHMNGRLYDSTTHRFLSPDNYVQNPYNTQNFNRYSYVLNNPLSSIDPSGESIILVAAVVGAILGAASGALTAHANGAQGFWEWFGYVGGGAVIGGLSGVSAAAISIAGGGAVLAGATAGAISGAGFGGLASGWNGRAIAKGALFGFGSGAIGAGLSALIGGGVGAFFGGVAGSITNTLAHGGTGLKVLYQAAIAGVISYGTYQLSTYLSWKQSGGKLGPRTFTLKEFRMMSAEFQRSRAWHREYGGIMGDETINRFPARTRSSHGINPDSPIMAERGGKMYHTHWDKPGKVMRADTNGHQAREGNTLESIKRFFSLDEFITTRGHSPKEIGGPIDSFVMNRFQESSFNLHGTSQILFFSDSFQRYFHNANINFTPYED